MSKKVNNRGSGEPLVYVLKIWPLLF